LESSEIKCSVTLAAGGTSIHPGPDDVVEAGLLEIKIEDTVEGIYQMKVTVTGTIPEIDGRYKEIKGLYIEITDADENALPPVILKVYNLDKFNSDLEKVKSEVEDLKSSVASLEQEGYDVTDALNKIDKIEANISVAEEYLKTGDYKDCDEKLTAIETGIQNVKDSLDKMKVEVLYSTLRETLDEVSSTLEDVDIYLAQVATKVSLETYTTFKSEYRDLQKEYEDLSEKINNIKLNYIDKGKYEYGYQKLQEYRNEINNLSSKADQLFSDVKSALFGTGEQQGWNFGEFLKQHVGLILAIMLGVIVVLAIVLVLTKRRGGKWDELR
jgi:archaellum component FlaC